MATGESRTPPQNIEAEQALLGACLLYREALENALEFVRAEDFYRERHQLIFEVLKDLLLRGVPADLVTVSAELSGKGQLERAGGMPYLASLTSAVPSAVSAAYYAGIIAEKALIRSLISAGGRIAEEGFSGQGDAASLIDYAERAIFSVSERRSSKGMYKVGDLVTEVFEQIGKIKANAGVTGVPTFRDLDRRLLSGLQRGDLIILAARPAMGKTSMAINIAQQAGNKHGLTAAVFSLEMPKEQLVQRMLCYQAQVDQSLVRAGRANSEDLSKLADAMIPFAKSEIYIDDTATITVGEIRAKCRRLKLEKRRLDLVVIDYLQLINGGRRSENRQQEISEISRSLKAMAKELDVPVLALSQLSRMAERGGDQPSLSHLRESGAIEQDADVVIFLHQNKSKTNDPQNLIEVIVAKHRNGPVGMVEMVFVPKYTSFENHAADWENPPDDYRQGYYPDSEDI